MVKSPRITQIANGYAIANEFNMTIPTKSKIELVKEIMKQKQMVR